MPLHYWIRLMMTYFNPFACKEDIEDICEEYKAKSVPVTATMGDARDALRYHFLSRVGGYGKRGLAAMRNAWSNHLRIHSRAFGCDACTMRYPTYVLRNVRKANSLVTCDGSDKYAHSLYATMERFPGLRRVTVWADVTPWREQARIKDNCNHTYVRMITWKLWGRFIGRSVEYAGTSRGSIIRI